MPASAPKFAKTMNDFLSFTPVRAITAIVTNTEYAISPKTVFGNPNKDDCHVCITVEQFKTKFIEQFSFVLEFCKIAK